VKLKLTFESPTSATKTVVVDSADFATAANHEEITKRLGVANWRCVGIEPEVKRAALTEFVFPH
jgi:hypothetical protein